MVFGRVQKERIALNDSSFWSGRPHDYNDTNAINYFPKIRDLVFVGKFQEAENMANEHFWGIPKAQQAYQPIGDLMLSFDGVDHPTDYRRELDMETGVAKVTFRAGDATFTREVFVSYPDRVMVVRLTADKPHRISFAAGLKGPFQENVSAASNKLVMDGCWKGPNPVPNALIAQVDGKGERFEVSLLARVDGGTSETDGDRLRINNADAVTLILTTATSYVNYHDISGDPAARCDNVLSACEGKDFSTLRQRHVEDFGALMGRVHLNVGDATLNNQPTDERLAAVRAGARDENLEALIFQFGRYILASSSRAGGQPANLQGIWNEDTVPPWGSKYTININTEMNYWPAEVGNLGECSDPLFDMIEDISATGAETAKDYYGCKGWVTHHNIDLWRGTAPVDAARYGMWPVGGAWLCQHIWEHYAFNPDRVFLEKYYPLLKGAAQFLLDVMEVEPKHHWLVTPFSMSPEHGYIDDNGNLAFLSPMPTMDLGIVHELFPHCIEASKVLGVDAEFRSQLETALTKIPPYQIGKSGFVQEWIEDWKAGDQGHNVSPNFPFFPGSSLTLRGNPDFAKAYQRWLESHRARGAFLVPWGMEMWARLERGDEVDRSIQAFVSRLPAPNLHNAGSNQSDASFGYSAAVAEALLQSHAGEISLLPALPTAWKDGSVSGLRARGGYEVSMTWKGGKLVEANIHAATDGQVRIRNGSITKMLTTIKGNVVHLDAQLTETN